MTQLLQCPCCGGAAEMNDLGDPHEFFASCTRCGLQQIAKHTEDTAVFLWNARIIPDSIAAENTLLRADAERFRWLLTERVHYGQFRLELVFHADCEIPSLRECIDAARSTHDRAKETDLG